MLEPASGSPKRSSDRAFSELKPKRSAPGANQTNNPAAIADPANWPTARLIAPIPLTAQPTETSALVQLPTWSASILRAWRKVRYSIATGAVAMPLTTTLHPSNRTTGVAAGPPLAEENAVEQR